MTSKTMGPIKDVILETAQDLYDVGLMKEKDLLQIQKILKKESKVIAITAEGKSTRA